MMQRPVHTIGDSHCRITFQVSGNINAHNIIACTMHRVGRDLDKGGISFRDNNIPDGAIVITSFGEIDVRVHVHKQLQLNRDLDEILNTLVSGYEKYILHNLSQYKDLKIIVMGVVPPTNNGYNPDYPFNGTLDERLIYTKEINKRLELMCRKNNFYFLSVYDEYKDKNGYLDVNKSDLLVHIGNPIFIYPKLFYLMLLANLNFPQFYD